MIKERKNNYLPEFYDKNLWKQHIWIHCSICHTVNDAEIENWYSKTDALVLCMNCGSHNFVPCIDTNSIGVY